MFYCKRIKTISLILILVMMFQIVLSGFSANAYAGTDRDGYFIDIKTHWSRDFVQEFYERGITKGFQDGSFRPDAKVTRAEFACFLNRAFQLSGNVEEESFIDVKVTDWFYKDVEIVKKLGYVNGYPGRLFKPGNELTREEAAAIIARFIEGDEKVDETQIYTFSDGKKISDWAKRGVALLKEKEILKGMPDGSFSPQKPITRAEVCKLILVTLKVKEDKEEKNDKDDKDIVADTGNGQPGNPIPEIKNPVVAALEPSGAVMGTVVTIRGQYFGNDKNKLKVLFEGAKQGKMEAGLLTVSDGSIEVLVPGVQKENLKVYVDVAGLKSNQKDFALLGISEAPAGKNLASETLSSITSLLQATKHETQIGLTPFLEKESGDQLISELDNMVSEISQSIASLTQGKTEEELKLINNILSAPAIQEQLAGMTEAADILSHSTTSEALGNIIEAKKALKEIKSMLDNIAYVFTIAKNTAATLATAAAFYGDFATAATLGNIASQITNILSNVINPAREIVGGILSILDMAPTRAVEDSLVLYAYQNDLGIDQYFKNLEVTYSRKDPKSFYEEKANKILSAAVIIDSDMKSMSNREVVGEAAGMVIRIASENALTGEIASAYDIASGIRKKGAAEGYANKRETITALKNYSEKMVKIEAGIKRIKNKAREMAEACSTRLLIKDLNDPIEIISIRSMSLNKKIYIINQNEELSQSNDGIRANQYYKVYLSTELILNRTLADLVFDYFETEPIDNLVTGHWYPNYNQEWGSLSETIRQLVIKIGKIQDYEIEEMIAGHSETADNIEDLGCIYVAQPYFFKGHVDYTSRDNDFLNVENVLKATGNSTNDFVDMSNPIAALITKMLMNLVDDKLQELLKIDLTDVDVALKVSFFDEDGTERLTSDIIEWQWIKGSKNIDGVEVSNKLMLKGKKPGEEIIMITAVLVEGEDYEEEGKEAFSIKRRIKAVSGFEEEAPYTKGPEIEKVTNLNSIEEDEAGTDNKGYIGDVLKIDGFGFSKLVQEFQNVFFGSAQGYNDSGAAHKWLQTDFEYRGLKVEIPDALTGDLVVSVGPDGGSLLKWPSNPVQFIINPPRIDYANSTAIKGEAWPVWGRGFSHTASFNKGIWNASGAQSNVIKPPSLLNAMKTYDSYEEPVGSSNHGELHKLHKRLDFIVPGNAGSGQFYVNTIGTLDSESREVAVREFSGNTVISSGEREGLRPSVARDNTTDRRMAVWIDQNASFNNMLVAALIEGSGKASDPVVVSENTGGIPTAPEAPSVSSDMGVFQVVWTGLENDNDEVFFSYSQNGTGWSTPVKISDTPSAASLQPVVKACDIDNDGDADAVVVWREDNGFKSHVFSRILINNGNSFEPGAIKAVSEGNSAYDADIAAGDGRIAFVWAENGEIYLKEYNCSKNTFSNPVNVSESPMRKDGYPSLAYYKDSETGTESWAVVWEQLSRIDLGDGRVNDFKEDICFARLDTGTEPSGGRVFTIAGRQNISNSKQHSQKPVIGNDGNNNLAVVWVEQGYEEEDTNQTGLYKSSVVFARSFNGGEEFNRPYMRLQSFDNSTRLGHIDLTADKDAFISFVWQADKAGHKEVYFTTTEGNARKPEHDITNAGTGRTINYSLMRNEDNNWFLAKEDGVPLRTYVTQGLDGKFSPSGKYLAFSSGWVLEAEADGSHPVGIFRAFNDNAVDIYWSSEEDILSANFVENGFTVFERSGVRKGSQSGGMAVFNNPWFEDKALAGVLKFDWVERTDENGSTYFTNAITDAYINVFSEYGSQVQRFGENGDTFGIFSPDGTKIALIKHENNDKILEQSSYPSYRFKGRLYTASSGGGYDNPLTEEHTASSPSWSPNSKKIVFINEEASGKYVTIAEPYKQPVNPVKLSNEISDAEIVVFSQDGKKVYVLRQEGFAQVDVDTGEVTDIPGFPFAYAGINRPEGGLDISEYNILLDEGEKESVRIKLKNKPDSGVTVNIHGDRAAGIAVFPETISFDDTNWNVEQLVEIQSLDNDTYEGVVQRAVTFSITSDDAGYNNYINKNIYVTVIENEPDPGDITPPVWVNGKAEVSGKGTKWIEITWSGASDNLAVDSYKVYLDGVFKKQAATESVLLTGLERNREYLLKIEAVDNAGNESSTGPQLPVKTLNEENFYPGELYDKDGMQQGDGQPSAYGWTRQSVYMGPEGQGLRWLYEPGESLWTVSSPVIGNDGTVYYTGKSDSGSEWYLYAVNSDGALKWKKTFTGGMEGMQAAPHITQNNEIIVVGKEKVYFLNNSGNAIWTFEPDGPYTHSSGMPIDGDRLIPTSASVSSDGTVYFTAANSSYKRLMLYAVKDGQKLWKYQSNMYADSTVNNQGSMFTTPVPLANGYILFGREIVQVVGGMGYTKYKFETDEIAVKTTPVVGSQGYVYLALKGQSGALYCLDMAADENKVVYKKEIGISGDGIALGSDGTVYTGADSGYLLSAVDAAGNTKWQFAGQGAVKGAPLIDFEGNIYFASDQNKMYSVNSSGELIWEFDTVPEALINGQISMPALDGDSNLYLTTANGLYALGIQKDSKAEFKENTCTVDENAGVVNIAITRSGDGKGECVVYLEADEESTLLQEEYELSSGKVCFRDGEAEKTVSVSLKDDSVKDGNKKLILSIAKVVGGERYGSCLKTVINVIDNENSDSLSIEKQSYTIEENAGNIDIKIIRTFGGSNAPGITVDYQTNDGTAKAGVDYTAVSGTLVFDNIEMEKTVSIPVADNSSYKGNRSFTLVLKNASAGVDINTAYAQIEIAEDEASPVIEYYQAEKTVGEADGKITITVKREGDLSVAAGVFVEFNSVLSSAVSSADFGKFSGTYLEFGAGESQKSFDITVIDDMEAETSEVIILDLTNPQGATLGRTWRMTIRIADNEQTVQPPVAEAGWEGGYGHIWLTNLTPGARIRLYNNDGTLQREPFNIGSTSYRVNSVPVGNGYYVTQEVGGVESPASNYVDVAVPKGE